MYDCIINDYVKTGNMFSLRQTWEASAYMLSVLRATSGEASSTSPLGGFDRPPGLRSGKTRTIWASARTDHDLFYNVSLACRFII